MTEGPSRKSTSPQWVIVLAVIALFVGILGAKILATRGPAIGESEPTAPSAPAAASLTSVHNDASSDFAAARKTGKPVYVLFHSLSCEPCIEISRVADDVLPEFAGRVVFVNAITADPSAQQLAARFPFQYIPTSFFVRADGSVSDSYTGALSREEMRVRLDRLVAE